MANRDGREALRGAAEETLDLIAQALAPEQWTELLRGPLERASAMGNRRLARKLVEAGANVGNALHNAIRGGHRGTADDLLRSGASTATKNGKGNTPLHVAARGGKPEMVSLLVLHGADKDAMDKSRRTPVYLAVCCGHAAVALALVAAGADLDLRCTPLDESVISEAARQGQLEFLRAAVEHGADVDAACPSGYTALHVAALRKRAESIEVLIEVGASLEATNASGCTPLHDATSLLANLPAVLALLGHGADANAQDQNGETPLHMAARITRACPDAAGKVDALLRSGADEGIVDDRGAVAEDLIDDFGSYSPDERSERVRKLLVNAPADRAWRRRGYLVLCRAHPGRVWLVEESSSATAGGERRKRSVATPSTAEASGCDNARGGAVNGDACVGGWSGVLAAVLGMQEEGIFRRIVGFL